MKSDISTIIADFRNRLSEHGVLRPETTILFHVGNCVLMENPTVRGFGYRAVAVDTFETKHLFYRQSKLERSGYRAAAEKITYLPFYTDQATPSLRERAGSLLSIIFTAILPQYGFIFRQGQLDLARAMLDAIWDRRLSLCEAGVGSGKTLAYLVAAVVYDLFSEKQIPTIISTSTIALQKAITEEYIPQLSDILLAHRITERPLTFLIRKGKSHYVCDARLRTYYSSIRNLGRDPELLDHLTELLHADIQHIDLSGYPLTRYVKDRICVSGRCQSTCPNIGNCRYRAYSQLCTNRRFDFQVTNHNYVFAHILNQKDGKRELLPDYKLLIFDEAHKLLETARQMYGSRLAQSEIPALLDSVSTSRIPDGKARLLVDGWMEMLEKRNTVLFGNIKARMPKGQDEPVRYDTVISDASRLVILNMMDGLAHLPELCRLHGDGRMRADLESIRWRCEEITQRLSDFIGDEELICWLENIHSDPLLCATPKDLAALLYRDIWKSDLPYVMTSGTLSVNRCFSLVKRNLGIDWVEPWRISAVTMPSPFDYQNNTLLYIPQTIPFPNIHDPAYIKSVAEEIKKLICVTNGHTLILFTSYWLMERVYGMLRGELEKHYPVFIMNRGRVDAIARYRNSENGILFASDAAGEGIDLAGDILSSLIIVKLPFAVPDPITQYEQSQYPSLQRYLEDVTVPNMLIKLKQYTGRAIRTEDDTAVISILDSRVAPGGKYRRAVLDALFSTTVTSSIYDVWAFIHNRKNREYFCGGTGNE